MAFSYYGLFNRLIDNQFSTDSDYYLETGELQLQNKPVTNTWNTRANIMYLIKYIDKTTSIT